jgi:hypothetical protein
MKWTFLVHPVMTREEEEYEDSDLTKIGTPESSVDVKIAQALELVTLNLLQNDSSSTTASTREESAEETNLQEVSRTGIGIQVLQILYLHSTETQ